MSAAIDNRIYREVETKTNIYSKLLAIMSDVNYIQKDKTNSFHKYNYASEAAIKEKLHAVLVKHRVLFLPYKTEMEERVTGLGKDQKEALTTIKLYYRFVDVDSGETHEGELHGVGSDAMDKGIYKAVTGAIKYILTGTFLIATGDDPEAEPSPTKAEGRQAQQAVAARKIQEIHEENAAHSEGKPRIAGPKAETWDGRVVIAQFERAKNLIGEAAYHQVLKEAGIDLPEHSPDRDFAMKLYRRMADIAIKQGKDLSKAS
jgi:hypothetical protein